MGSTNEHEPKLCVKSCQCILERAGKSLEQDDLEVRIARLEATQQEKE